MAVVQPETRGKRRKREGDEGRWLKNDLHHAHPGHVSECVVGDKAHLAVPVRFPQVDFSRIDFGFWEWVFSNLSHFFLRQTLLASTPSTRLVRREVVYVCGMVCMHVNVDDTTGHGMHRWRWGERDDPFGRVAKSSDGYHRLLSPRAHRITTPRLPTHWPATYRVTNTPCPSH